MRYENPHYMAEDAGAADLIAGRRLQFGVSRGSPEPVIDGWHYFGYLPAECESDADMGRRYREEFLELLRGKGFALDWRCVRLLQDRPNAPKKLLIDIVAPLSCTDQ